MLISKVFFRELGRGYYGTVYLAEELSGRLVAVKSLASRNNNKQKSDPNNASDPASESSAGSVPGPFEVKLLPQKPSFSHECAVLRELGRHVNVVKLVSRCCRRGQRKSI